MSNHTEKATWLMEQNRYELALNELQQHLLAEPDDAHSHALMAVCLRQLDRGQEALAAARRAVALAPDNAFPHYVLAGVLCELDQYKKAEPVIREAIRLEPEDADYHSRLGAIQFQQRQWEQCLDTVERALALDPTQPQALNLRSMALGQLSRKDEAEAATASALAAHPEDPQAHTAKGWQALNLRDLDSAGMHFKEALRLDSSLSWAREGLVETLKARNPVYRVMLAYFLWMGRLSSKAMWGFIIGGYLGSRVLMSLAKSNPAWAPYIWVVLGLYLAFCLMTWVADPLFNLLLRWHPLGRYALSKRQTQAANGFGGSLLLAALSALLGLALDMLPLLLLAVVAALMAIPLSNALDAASARARRTLLIWTGVLATLGALAVAGSLFGPGNVMTIPLMLFLAGVVVFFWVANFVNSRA